MGDGKQDSGVCFTCGSDSSQFSYSSRNEYAVKGVARVVRDTPRSGVKGIEIASHTEYATSGAKLPHSAAWSCPSFVGR